MEVSSIEGTEAGNGVNLDLDNLLTKQAVASRFEYTARGRRPAQWIFDGGWPDPSTFPVEDLSRLAGQVLRASDALQYDPSEEGGLRYGHSELRRLLAARTASASGQPFDLPNIMLCAGGVHGLALILRAFVGPGDIAAVEGPTWGVALDLLRERGAETIALPLDDDGIVIDTLEERLRSLAHAGQRLKLVYTIASFHTPTGVSLSIDRRRRLLELAETWGFLIVEDNVYGDIRFAGQQTPTVLELDTAASVLRLDSFSKTVAPALRLGWITGPSDALTALAGIRNDLGVSRWTAAMIAEYLNEGLFDRHLTHVNDLYLRKRDAVVQAMLEHCGDLARWRLPSGGFFLWVELDSSVDCRRAMRRAWAEGVICRPGERFFGNTDAARQFLRIAYSQVPTDKIEAGIEVLGKALRASVPRTRVDFLPRKVAQSGTPDESLPDA